MDDDDSHEDDDRDEDESTGTYSKKKHFGKLDKDFRGWVAYKITYRFKNSPWKPFSFSIEKGKFTLTHKKQIDDLKSNTKLKFNTRYGQYPKFNQLSSKISKKVAGTTLSFSNKISDNMNLTSKMAHSVNLWDKLKVKYGLQAQKKKQIAFGGNIGFTYKRSFAQIPYLPFLSFVSKYNETFHIGTNLKTSKRPKWDAEYNSHLISRDNHRVYFSHKFAYDLNTKNPSPISQTITLNAQDGDSIATVNTSLHLEKFNIKSKEIRFLIEYDKKYRFGVQKRNDIFEFLVQRYKISQGPLKAVKFSVGNKGFFSEWQGKFSPWKGMLEYSIKMKLKPGGGNFYNDFSSNVNLKWNL